MKRLFVLACLIMFYVSSFSQDVVKVMQYNLLYYGTNTGWCNANNNSVEEKNAYIRTILEEVRPDIMTVCEFGADESLVESFLSSNLNINGVDTWKSTPIINMASSNIINCIFYDSDKLTMRRHSVAQSYLRDIDVYEMYFNTDELAQGDTIELVCVVGHLKAGNGSDNKNKRKVMIQSTMNYLEKYFKEKNILIMGDFNFYDSDEPAYQLMTNSVTYPNSYFIDPLGQEGVGDWNNNYQYKNYHTQSTNAENNGCASSGGMDDRFDFILMSENISTGRDGVRYVADSYESFGNDGNHFNESINASPNDAVSQEVADALYHNSDHLPVILKLQVDAEVGLAENGDEKIKAEVFPNPTDGDINIKFNQKKSETVEIEIFNIVGQKVYFSENSIDDDQMITISTEQFSKGLYIIKIHSDERQYELMKFVVR